LIIDIVIEGRKMKALLDSGAQGNYISPKLINRHHLPWDVKNQPYRLRMFDGGLTAYDQGWVRRETAPLTMTVGGSTDVLRFDIASISQEVILGIPWLRHSNPRVNWTTGQVQWDTPGSYLVTEEQDRARRSPSNKYGQVLRAYVMAREPKDVLFETIPAEYRKYAKLFSGKLETGLPEHSRWDHEIVLQAGKEPKFSKCYPLNEKHREALKEYLDENLKKGYIRPSQSPAGYPILFVPKKNGKYRLCVDFRQLNDITVKNRYPLPLISELRDRLHGANWFTALDLKGAYNLIRMKEGEEWKTAFRTTLGHYEYLVMPFGLTNAPATFQTMIDWILRDHIGSIVVVYLDDILIYSKTLEEHKGHVHTILQILQDNKLLVEPEKCEFHKQKVKFLGHEITPGQIRMDPDKLRTIQDWPTPNNLKEVRAFLGFANYYRRYIQNYGRIAIPLTDLTKQDQDFQWNEKAERAFQTLKESFLRKPVLATADPNRPFEMETDASDYILGGTLG
jgi:hypothetical protein